MTNSTIQNDDEDGQWETFNLYFRQTLDLLTQGPQEQVSEMGGPAAAWEIRDDAIYLSSSLLLMGSDKLAVELKVDIENIIRLLNELPEKAYQGDSIEGLSDQSWDAVRQLAQAIKGQLDT
jgi:hypothetical protein